MLRDIENLSYDYIKQSKIVITSGNFGFPYKVIIDKQVGHIDVHIYINKNYDTIADVYDMNYVLLKRINATIVEIRNNNCVLIKSTDGLYYLVSDMCYSFQTKNHDPITKFISITYDGIPYCIAYSNLYIYVLCWEAIMPLLPQYENLSISDILSIWGSNHFMMKTIKLK